MEVGPLARVLVLYASGDETTRGLVDKYLKPARLPVSACSDDRPVSRPGRWRRSSSSMR